MDNCGCVFSHMSDSAKTVHSETVQLSVPCNKISFALNSLTYFGRHVAWVLALRYLSAQRSPGILVETRRPWRHLGRRDVSSLNAAPNCPKMRWWYNWLFTWKYLFNLEGHCVRVSAHFEQILEAFEVERNRCAVESVPSSPLVVLVQSAAFVQTTAGRQQDEQPRPPK